MFCVSSSEIWCHLTITTNECLILPSLYYYPNTTTKQTYVFLSLYYKYITKHDIKKITLKRILAWEIICRIYSSSCFCTDMKCIWMRDCSNRWNLTFLLYLFFMFCFATTERSPINDGWNWEQQYKYHRQYKARSHP